MTLGRIETKPSSSSAWRRHHNSNLSAPFFFHLRNQLLTGPLIRQGRPDGHGFDAGRCSHDASPLVRAFHACRRTSTSSLPLISTSVGGPRRKCHLRLYIALAGTFHSHMYFLPSPTYRWSASNKWLKGHFACELKDPPREDRHLPFSISLSSCHNG